MARALAAPRSLRDGEISLCPVGDAVAPLLLAASLDPAVTRWTQIPEGLTMTDAGMITAGWSLPSERSARFQVCERDGPPVGMVTLWLDAAGVAEVGYWLLEPARGRGVATTALRLLCAWAFDDCALDELQLTTLPGNVASEAVAAKCGFIAAGTTERSFRGRTVSLRLWRRRREVP